MSAAPIPGRPSAEQAINLDELVEASNGNPHTPAKANVVPPVQGGAGRPTLELEDVRVLVGDNEMLLDDGETKIGVMKTNGAHDILVDQSLVRAGFNLAVIHPNTYGMLKALASIDYKAVPDPEEPDGYKQIAMIRPRDKGMWEARVSMFWSGEIVRIAEVYAEVNGLTNTAQFRGFLEGEDRGARRES